MKIDLDEMNKSIAFLSTRILLLEKEMKNFKEKMTSRVTGKFFSTLFLMGDVCVSY